MTASSDAGRLYRVDSGSSQALDAFALCANDLTDCSLRHCGRRHRLSPAPALAEEWTPTIP